MPRRRNRPVTAPPAGFLYHPEFLTQDEEWELVAKIEALPFEHVFMHGVEGRREVVHFGVRYQYGARALLPAPPPPPFMADVLQRACAIARLPSQAPIEALVTRYQPGAGINWHRDAPPFGPVVVGISLLNACTLRLRLATNEHYEVYEATLAPRSLYVLAGTARFRWQHRIPPVASLRYSLTIRTVRPNRGHRRGQN